MKPFTFYQPNEEKKTKASLLFSQYFLFFYKVLFSDFLCDLLKRIRKGLSF